MSDITRNKQSQLALSASETLLRRAGHLANMGAWAIDLKTRKLYWSEYMYELHGVSQDFVPSLENALIFYSPEDRKLIQLAIKNTIEHQIPWELEIPLITEAGIQKWVHGVGDVEYEEGHPVRIVGALQDVTVQLLERIQMQNLLHVAEEASKAKAQFLANMSHEIRTPMNAIKGMLKLLEQSKLTSNQHDYVSKAEGATKSLLSIINDVLDFSKIDAGKMELERASFHVDTMLRELSVILSSNLGRKHIEILFDVDPAVPETLIGDSLRLQQVLINLGSNAIKFTDTGEVIVKLELLRSDSRGCLLKFSVTDTGIGIASQSLERIFEGFSQAESSTTRKHGGTGLGLTISKRMISLMGGELKVESTLGLGSVFSFALNLAIAENALEAPVENFANNIAGADSFDVLVVDDNPLACKLTVLMAKQCGWNVNAASNGLEAIAMVENRLASGMRPFGAALLDWNMPGIDGWETAARMRALSAPNPPIIVMVTSSTREELASRSELEQDALGDYLVKPVTATMLRESVGKARKGNRGMRNQKLKAVQSERGLVGMRILVVEDNMINQQVAEELLKAQGASVSIACNGQLGVDAVRGASPQFDVVLMDLQMPVMDGLTAARVLRQEFGKDALPIIAMTANAMASDRAACLEAGMNDHIGKPFDLSELVRNIVKHTGWSVAADNFALPIVHSAGEATNLVGFPWPDCLDGVHAIARMGGNVSLFERSLAKYLELLSAHSQTMQNLIAQGDIEATRRDFHSLKSNSASLGVLAIAALAAQCEKMTIHASTERLAPQTEELQALIASLLPSLRQAHAALGERLNEVFRLSGGTDSQDSLAGYRVALQELLDQLTAGDMTAMETHAALRQRIEPAWADLFDPLDISMAEMEFELAAVHCKTLLARQKS
jgi:signal transduction histidine kinase/CheY-like chemotaxis protein